MSFIFTIIGSMLLLDAACWWVLARQTENGIARVMLGVFMGAQMLGLIALVVSRLVQIRFTDLFPKWAAAALFLWHFIGLSFFIIIALVTLPVVVTARLAGTRQSPATAMQDRHDWTRREFLGLAAAAAPPLFTFTLTGVALRQLNQFRVRRFTIPIAGLPPALDNLTIAQVSDMHVGRFTSGRVLDEMVATVNALEPDLILLTGDIINDALVDLARGLELVRQMQSRFGAFLIEGNHDLIENAAEFERRVKASGIPFLLDESAIVTVRDTPVQLLGLSWTRAHQDRDAAIGAAVRRLLRQQRSDAFAILLAHHPHAFDAAAAAGIPLTLSGHTHGGQLMLNEQLGFGPAMFRYWSGLYERAASKLIVSNGVGNWFPLRTNAPAELVHITLRAA